MNQHLSPEQISRWMAGERTTQMEQHARECSVCQAEIARMESAISMFRGAVRNWSDRQSVGGAEQVWESRPRLMMRPMRWAMAAAALLILVAAPVYQGAREKQRRAEAARADALLLEQVDAEVSQAVPRTMEPLARLAAWDSTGTTGKEGGRIQ